MIVAVPVVVEALLLSGRERRALFAWRRRYDLVLGAHVEFAAAHHLPSIPHPPQARCEAQDHRDDGHEQGRRDGALHLGPEVRPERGTVSSVFSVEAHC
jgi:hypothetical protein